VYTGVCWPLCTSSPARHNYVFLCLQSYVGQLLPASSSDPTALSLEALQGATLVQINSSAAVLALAKSAGFDSIQAFMPGLQMFWDDVSMAACNPGLALSNAMASMAEHILMSTVPAHRCATCSPTTSCKYHFAKDA
jgi:hypothetical protein